MTIVVQGSLVSPLNTTRGGIEIRVEALNNELSILGMVGSESTQPDGSYSFQLTTGDHRIEINFNEEYKDTGEVRVPVTLPPPYSGTITLAELLSDPQFEIPSS